MCECVCKRRNVLALSIKHLCRNRQNNTTRSSSTLSNWSIVSRKRALTTAVIIIIILFCVFVLRMSNERYNKHFAQCNSIQRLRWKHKWSLLLFILFYLSLCFSTMRFVLWLLIVKLSASIFVPIHFPLFFLFEQILQQFVLSSTMIPSNPWSKAFGFFSCQLLELIDLQLKMKCSPMKWIKIRKLGDWHHPKPIS